MSIEKEIELLELYISGKEITNKNEYKQLQNKYKILTDLVLEQIDCEKALEILKVYKNNNKDYLLTTLWAFIYISENFWEIKRGSFCCKTLRNLVQKNYRPAILLYARVLNESVLIEDFEYSGIYFILAYYMGSDIAGIMYLNLLNRSSFGEPPVNSTTVDIYVELLQKKKITQYDVSKYQDELLREMTDSYLILKNCR
jgi:hypothetical protein